MHAGHIAGLGALCCRTCLRTVRHASALRAFVDTTTAGHPKGVPVRTEISECKPKLYNVELSN